MSATGGFGSGLGTVIGANLASNDLESGLGTVNNIGTNFQGQTDPYDTFGQSFLDPASSAITGVSNTANNTQGYNQFMSTYTNTPAAQYQLQQADQVQNNSAASKGGLLSGANERALGTINNGIVSQNANNAYNEYLSGSSAQFGQLESALGNMFSAIGVGQTATGQQAGVDTAQIGATSQLAQAQAKNDQGKGSGLGSMFGNLPTFSF